MRTTISVSWAGWRVAFLIALAAASAVASAEPLFPEPLHLTRRVDDPISDTSVTLEEYCVGNRIITVRGRKVAIADYEAQQITEIDHAASTYSITRFADIARAKQPVRAMARKDTGSPTALGLRASAAGRSLDTYEMRADGVREKPTLEIGIDRSVTISREALDVIVGAAYPNEPTWQQEAIARASARPARRLQSTSSSTDQTAETYGLPADQSLSWDVDGKRMTMRNVITAVDHRMPPPDLLMIPRGARLIEPPTVTTRRLLEELESGKPKD